MAEVAGILLGVVPLISCFKDCVDLFSYISVGRSLGRDYELLNTKLDVEKTLLLQWSQRVRLLQQRPDSRLEDPGLQEMTTKVLKSIAQLLSDSKVLQNRYGLRPEDEDVDTVADSDSDAEWEPDDESKIALKRQNHQESRRPYPALSQRRLEFFTHQFNRLNLKRLHSIRDHERKVNELSLKPQTSETSARLTFEKLELRKAENLKLQNVRPSQRVRWAVHDTDKFDNLVQDLSYFIRKLNEMMPDVPGPSEEMTTDDLNHLPDSRVHLVFQASVNRATVLANAAKDLLTRNCETRVLRAVWFRFMDDRREYISKPSSKTLEWVLKPRETDTEWDDLTTWLQSESGVYWISGKAGSGKSVLMKHLCNHNQTQKMLNSWANGSPLTVANFFFWALAPTVEQKSLSGLSRALLYQILEGDRSLIPQLLPGIWEEAYGKDVATVSSPSLAEMKRAFEILGCIPDHPRKFCFFIDGLDEYDGDISDGITFLLNCTSNPSIKVVMSSRPLASCVQAFSTFPKLQMHDLTESDIRAYVDEAITTHPHMLGLLKIRPSQAQDISETIVNKSSGVFLWVVLACRSLRQGLDGGDSISDLRRRLDELPPELKDLFQHMLSNVPSRYRPRAAMYIRLLYECKANQDTEELSTLGMALMDAREMDPTEFHVIDNVSIEERTWSVETLEKRLRSCCCGLLEVRRSRRHDGAKCFCDGGPDSGLVDSQIDFIHRSVYEFLNLPGSWALDALQIHDDSFDAYAILAYLSLYLASFRLQRIATTATPYLRDVLRYGLRMHQSSSDMLSRIMKQLTETWLNASVFDVRPWIEDHESKASGAWDRWKASSNLSLLLCIEAGMTDLIINHGMLVERPQFRPTRFPLLYHALSTPILKYRWNIDLPMPASTIHFLLSSGYDPNEVFLDERMQHETTPWKYWLSRFQITDIHSAHSAADLIEAFIRAGANCADWCQVGRTVPDGLLSVRVKQEFCVNGGRPLGSESVLSTGDLRTIRDRGNKLLTFLDQHRSEQMGTSQNSGITSPQPHSIAQYEVPRKRRRSRSWSPDAQEAMEQRHRPPKRQNLDVEFLKAGEENRTVYDGEN